MNISINIFFVCRGMNVYRSGTFPTKGRPKEKVAVDWIQEIKKEMDVDQLISVIVDGKEDITEKVKGMMEAPLNE